jgi:hypothetical protein
MQVIGAGNFLFGMPGDMGGRVLDGILSKIGWYVTSYIWW